MSRFYKGRKFFKIISISLMLIKLCFAVDIFLKSGVKAEAVVWYYGQNTNEANRKDVLISCNDIQREFKLGESLFDNEDSTGEFLVRSGLRSNESDPFNQIFAGDNFPRNITEQFYKSSRVLRGTQKIADLYKRNFLNVPSPQNADIEDFFSEASKCIPLEGRSANRLIPPCRPNEIYRRFDGSCNNLLQPLRGASFTPFSRFVDADYDDNVLEIRRSTLGNELISPRTIVNDAFTKPNPTILSNNFIPNLGFFFFGQFLTHDFAGAVNIHHRFGTEEPIRCCSADFKTTLPKSQSHFGCLPISIPASDAYYGRSHLGCHTFVRSQPIFPNDAKLSAAQQTNRVTSYLDLSNTYGFSTTTNNRLRAPTGGLMKTNENNVLPVRPSCDGPDCFDAGDRRVNQTPSLAALTSIFIRLHNKIAVHLGNLNPHWDNEKIFQEARRINIALMQHITYKELVPMLIGQSIDSVGFLNDYNETVDGTTMNDFTTAAFRVPHVFTPKFLELYNANGQLNGKLRLSQILGDARILNTQYDDVVRGLIFQKIVLEGHTDEVRNRLFNDSDLISVDIQRSRDHGLAPYWKYRQICGLGKIYTFSDLQPLISPRNILLLKSLYKSPLDIDLYVGGVLEERKGNVLGPTLQCITKVQFARFKFGDRFFYTHSKSPYPLTKQQLKSIKRFSFSNLICSVTDVDSVPLNGFFAPSPKNPLVSCSKLPKLNLLPWVE